MAKTPPSNKTPLNLPPGISGAQIETTLYNMVTQCNNKDDQLKTVMTGLGFTAYCFMLVASGNRRLPQPLRLISTLPRELTATYDLNQYYRRDIILDYAFQHHHDVLYSDLHKTLATTLPGEEVVKTNDAIRSLFKVFDYRDILISPHHADGQVTVLLATWESNEEA